MAYTYTVDTRRAALPGHAQKLFRVKVVETDVQPTSEAVVTGLPIFGTILRYKATLTPAAAATIQPRVGLVAAWTDSTQNEVTATSAAAAHIDNDGAVQYHSPSGTLHLRSTPDVAGDSVETEILVYQGWIS